MEAYSSEVLSEAHSGVFGKLPLSLPTVVGERDCGKNKYSYSVEA
jgi:hypothetical protein